MLSYLVWQYSQLSLKTSYQGNILTINQKPIEFASVIIYPSEDSTQIIGLSTNEQGSFKFENLKTGNYFLIVQMFGYEDMTREISLSKNTQLEPIQLKDDFKHIRRSPNYCISIRYRESSWEKSVAYW